MAPNRPGHQRPKEGFRFAFLLAPVFILFYILAIKKQLLINSISLSSGRYDLD
jgi:hypothetical protein